MHKRKLISISANVGHAIYSFRMGFTDCETPQFGKDACNKSLTLEDDEIITEIKICASQIRISGIILSTNKQRDLKFIGQSKTGNWLTQKIDPQYKLVGLHGTLSASNSLAGLGFLLWRPL